VAEPIHAVFRAIHSIKGCAAFLGLDAIRTFSHAVENSLDKVRNGAVPLDDTLERCLVEAFDRLDALLQVAAEGSIAEALLPDDTRILDAIQAAVASSSQGPATDAGLLDRIRAISDALDAGQGDLEQCRARLQNLLDEFSPREPGPTSPPSPKLLPGDCRDARFFCGQADVTEMVAGIVSFFLEFPEHRGDKASERECLLRLMEFTAWSKQAGHGELAEAFDAAAADFRTIHESPLDFDSNLASLVWEHLAPALGKLRAVDRPAATAEPCSDDKPPCPKAATAPAATEAKVRFVRVKEERLDEFLEHVSRMFITSQRLRDVQSHLAESRQLPEIAEQIHRINTDLKSQSTSLQRGVMALRQVSAAGLFAKLPRMARSLASQLGKQLRVDLAGEDTEIDKQLSEDLDAALTHLVRNVVDHAIEPPDERVARGKAETGTLRIEAQSTRSQVILLIRDDGRGIDPDRVRAKAVEKGLLAPAEADRLSHDETLQLIFRPGFSTAERVSEVSGRGVGMDVVRSIALEHRGQVSVASAVGRGTTIRLEFPIRQATLVVDGLMVSAQREPFVIPFENIKEIVRVEPSQIESVHGRAVATVRGSLYDAVRLTTVVGLPDAPASIDEAETAVVVTCKRGSLFLRVDQILGHRQVVVSALKDAVADTPLLTGIAQLGGDRLAPVLNIPEIVKTLGSA
jgi:two-component system chemotaxis sensor kinase CheA